ncbi:hypothetical protein EDB19DRAFT_164630 [Suillus lakei]|nr:hypothetical protein EDB19DRAFT_164630 [Suillus lakei]
MEYSANDITAVRILQYLAYICTALVTFWDEWTFLLRSRWTNVKCLYIIARYVPFCLITADLWLTLAPDENANTCRITYALWSNNRIVLVAMLLTLFATIVSFIGIWFSATATSQYFTTSAIPGITGITGCYRTSSSVRLYLPFILLFMFQLGLVSLTLIRAIQNWRLTGCPLYAVLVKHNIFYYACGLLLSGLNVLVPMLFSNSAYHSFLEDLEVFILAILATRMHLHLWRIGRHAHDSEALLWISTSNLSPADNMF